MATGDVHTTSARTVRARQTVPVRLPPTRAATAASFLRSMSLSAAVASAAPSPHAAAVSRRLGGGGGIRGRRARPTRTALTLTRTATGRDAPSSGGGADESGDFREFHRDEQGRVIDSDGNPVAPPENGWVAEMEKEWAATGYDDRFFDDDWDEINRSSTGDAPTTPKPPVFPFADIKDSEWRETVRWEDEDDADDATALFVESGPAAGPGPNFFARAPPVERRERTESVTGEDAEDASRINSEAHVTDTTSAAHDLTEAQEAAIMGFASGLDAEQPEAEPEGPPAVLLAGFRVEEVPRVRELLDELGGHDVPVLPVPQAYLERPLIDALQIQEPDWEAPRSDDTFPIRGGEFGSRRCAVFSGLDRGEMATIVSAIEARGLPRLVTAVVTSENCERTLGEALALAVQDARSDARRKEAARDVDLEAAVRASDAAAAAENLSAAEQVRREIERQDALAADEAAASDARNERATRAERHMEKLKQEYVEKARARAGADAAIGNAAGEDPNPAGWPTLEDVEASAAKAEALGVDDVLRASGADGDALEAMVREALRGSERAEARDDTANARSEERGAAEEDTTETSPSIRAVDRDDDDRDDAVEGREVEIDPTRWATRVDPTVGRATNTSGTNDVTFADGPCVSSSSNAANDANDARDRDPSAPAIGEPSAAEPNPRASKARETRDAAAAGPPPARAGEPETASRGREVVEPQIMTRRMLRELAMRRGVSYAEMLAKAEAEGVELPEE